jgi:hypothetical protein
MMPDKPELIYIAGYGRSGSTLLERLLQFQPFVHACGEMTNFFRIYGSDSSRCSCGQSLVNCEFWGGIAQKLFKQDFSVQKFPYYGKLQKKREAHWSHGGSFAPLRYQDTYANLMQPFFEALARHPYENHVLIDSSKTAYSTPFRPIAISQLGQFRVRVIHLVRDPRGVVWSVKKGLNRKLEAGKKEKAQLAVTRAIAGWIFANRSANRLKDFFGEDNYFLIKYEDLVVDPAQVLSSISTNWNFDLQQSIHVAKEARCGSEIQLPIMHQLSGNRMRFSSTFSIHPDYNWKEKLDSKTNAFVKYCTMPLMKKYNYV